MNQKNSHSTTDQASLFQSGAAQDIELPLAQEIIDLSDRFAEFICINSFLSESLSMLLKEGEEGKPQVARGAQHCVESMQTQAIEIKHALDRFRERYLAELEAQSLPAGD